MPSKSQARQSRKARVRKKITGTAQRPRLTVYRSLNHLYAQVIDDSSGRTLAQASTLSKELASDIESLDKKSAAKKVGELLARRCQDSQVVKVVFDRNGLPYHGRIAAVADGAREAGLQF